MSHSHRWTPLIAWVALVAWMVSVSTAPAPALGAAAAKRHDRGAVATVHPWATKIAMDVLADGGNAVDAAVAAALTLNVVDGHNSGIGGGCFIVMRLADGRLVAIDGREKAPAAATRDMYVRDGKADTSLSTTGALASGVPGALAAYDWAVRRYGKHTLADALHPAAELARRGFLIDAHYAQRLAGAAEALAKFDGAKAVFLKPDASPYAEGDVLRQPDLAATFDAIAEQGAGWFYHGPFAQKCAQWMKEHGGIMTADDFAQYQAIMRPAVTSTYRRYRVAGFPPPSSGGVHVAQILNILEQFDLAKMQPAQRIHVIAEAMKLAFADRAYWLGDADFANVPRGLVDKSYAHELACRIDLAHVIEVPSHGQPPVVWPDYFGQHHTTHICTADDQGNWVAITATINTGFGSKVVVPGTGVVLNNEMDDFSIQPGVPNVYGLIGAEANAIAPGKRPLSSMSPTIVLDKLGQPVLVCGAAGGPTIISQAVLTIVNHLDLGMPIDQALAAPRFHHQWSPDELLIEKAAGVPLIEQLRTMGHKVTVVDDIGVAQAIARVKHHHFAPAADPRIDGAAGVVTGE